MKKLLAFLAVSLLWAFTALAQTTGPTVLQSRPAGSGGPTIDDIATYTIGRGNFAPITFDMIGDSRTADALVTTCSPDTANPLYCGTNGKNWFVQASALANNRYLIGINAGLSGCRTDQYLQDVNYGPILASPNQWVLFGYPIINDLGAVGTGCAILPSGGSFPYTNTTGTLVDQSNVARVAASNIITASNRALALGKSVILTEEPGSTGINSTGATVASFTAFQASGVLAVTTVASGTIRPNQIVVGGANGNMQIVAQVLPLATGETLGGIGRYTVTGSGTAASGAMTTTYSTLAALYEFNSYIRAYANANLGRVYIWSANKALWNPAGSATTISFVSGILIDNATHFNVAGGALAAAQFNTTFQNVFPVGNDYEAASIDYFFPNSGFSYIQNPLFATLTGGANAVCVLSSGTVPSGWSQSCGVGTTAVTITSAASTWCNSAGNCGNDVTFAVTSAGADTFTIGSNSPSTNNWDLSYFFQAGAKVSVANGSSNCTLYADAQLSGNTGTRDVWILYGGDNGTGGGTNIGPTTAYSYDLRSYPSTVPTTSGTKNFINFRVLLKFAGAGACTVTISRPFLSRVYKYNPVAGTFSGSAQ